MARARVAIAQGEDAETQVWEALAAIEADKLIRPGERVALKPNYVEPMRPETGVTTDARVIEAVIRWLRDLGVTNITVAEGGCSQSKTDRAFQMVGLPEVAKRYDAKLLNVFTDESVTVRIPEAMSLKEIALSRTLVEADCLINLPKLKCHCMAYVTLGIKNLMGAITVDKTIMHRDLDERLCDLARVLPYRLCVIDGLIGGERHENAGAPVKTDVIIAGADPVATDAVGARVMGIDPEKVKHLRHCAEHGLGELSADQIEVVGAPIAQVRKKYDQPWGFG